MLAKKLLGVRPGKATRGKKFKKNRMAIAKFLTFNSNEMQKTNQYKEQLSLAKVML